jgi:hypothetical protein
MSAILCTGLFALLLLTITETRKAPNSYEGI